MKPLKIALFVFLLGSLVSKGADLGLSEKDLYSFEIYFSPDFNTPTLNAGTLLSSSRYKIVFKDVRLDEDQFAEAVAGLEDSQAKEIKGSFEMKWGFRILKGDRVLVLSFSDGWGRTGFCNGKHVIFGPLLGNWIRSNLTEVFQLKDTQIWSPSAQSGRPYWE